jgi:GST-like protein
MLTGIFPPDPAGFAHQTVGRARACHWHLRRGHASLWSAAILYLELFMTDLSAFPITRSWPARNPEILQLYSLTTPNGVKVSIMLEEIGLPYEAHRIDIGKHESWTPDYLSLNPNGKIPAIIDPNGPGGKPLALFESGAILFYLAEKTGRLLPADAARRYETMQWVFFQMAGVGPMFGQLGFFHKFAGREYEDKRPFERYRKESQRLLGVLETQLTGRDWIMDDEYTIADISLLGWVRNLIGSYGAREIVDYDSLKAVPAWLERGLARPAIQRGLEIPKRA